MTLLDWYTFIKGSNCGLNVKWSQLLVPLVKIVGRSKAEAAGDREAFRSGSRWRSWGVQKQRPQGIVGRAEGEAAGDRGHSEVKAAGDRGARSEAEAAGDCGAFRSGGRLQEGMSHLGVGLGTPFPFHSS